MKDCYGAVGVIHSLWKPLPGRFKDFIAMPKFNMYQSLHTTVIGPEGLPLEIQIRTREMHDMAEFGVAAHWIYKQGKARKGGPARPMDGEQKLKWLRHMLDWQQDLQDPKEFMETLKVDLFDEEVFVFTPKGEVKSLAAGATPLDFAYEVHTEIGHRCVGARVNGKIVPLHYELRSGDIVEVLTSKKERGPSRDWLAVVKTTRARNKIKAVVQGRVARGHRAHRPRPAAGAPAPSAACPRRRSPARRCSPTSSARWASARPRTSTSRSAARRSRRRSSSTRSSSASSRARPPRARRRRSRTSSSGAAPAPPADALEQPVRHPRRGRRRRHAAPGQVLPPGPGRPASSATSRSGAASRSTATTARTSASCSKDPDRFVEVAWEGDHETAFKVEIEVDAYDRTRLLEELSRTFAEAGINIVEARCIVSPPMVKNRFVVEVGDTSVLKATITRLRNIDSVFDAYRVTPTG